MKKYGILFSFILTSMVLSPVFAQPQRYRSERQRPALIVYENDNFHPPSKTWWTCESLDVFNMRNVVSDGGRGGSRGFNDKVTSVKWNVPPGKEIVLYENEGYKGWSHPLRGQGETANVGGFNDSVSSIRCKDIDAP